MTPGRHMKTMWQYQLVFPKAGTYSVLLSCFHGEPTQDISGIRRSAVVRFQVEVAKGIGDLSEERVLMGYLNRHSQAFNGPFKLLSPLTGSIAGNLCFFFLKVLHR